MQPARTYALPDPVATAPELALMRLAMLDCRAAGRIDAARACRILTPDADAGEVAHLLARALASAMIRRPVFYAPGAGCVSQDEHWLLALIAAIRRGDGASRRFLLARRCTPQGAVAVGLMVAALVEQSPYLESF